MINKLENAKYHDALKKLENDILRKIDSCALTGGVDRNNWIIDCDAQAVVYPLVVDLIDLLQQTSAEPFLFSLILVFTPSYCL